MKVAAMVVTNRVGTTKKRAIPTAKAVKRRAPRRPMRRPTTSEKMKVATVKVRKSSRGIPLKAS